MGTKGKSASNGLFPLQLLSKVVLSAVTVTIWSFLTNPSAFQTSGSVNSSRAWTYSGYSLPNCLVNTMV